MKLTENVIILVLLAATLIFFGGGILWNHPEVVSEAFTPRTSTPTFVVRATMSRVRIVTPTPHPTATRTPTPVPESPLWTAGKAVVFGVGAVVLAIVVVIGFAAAMLLRG